MSKMKCITILGQFLFVGSLSTIRKNIDHLIERHSKTHKNLTMDIVKENDAFPMFRISGERKQDNV